MADRAPVSQVLVPAQRWVRWCANFEARHGDTDYTVWDGSLCGRAVDGASFTARLPFGSDLDDSGDHLVQALVDAAGQSVPDVWGILLVRKGGFAVARLAGDTFVESKVGRRHVQGRTKAGGQSQQRFARRRANQARQAYEAASDHAVRILGGVDGPVVTGGDRTALSEVLTGPGLRDLAIAPRVLDVPEPRRAELERAVRDACAIEVVVDNAAG